MIRIKKLRDDAQIPTREYPTDSGLDLRCVDDYTLLVGERKLIKTGIAIELPLGYEAQVRARSGLASNQGITVLNGIGTIDQQYRGEIGVILINHGNEPVDFKHDNKIAQLVIAKVEFLEIVEAVALKHSDRGNNGFGSTGV
jgi:dUTP pyrophosphatase